MNTGASDTSGQRRISSDAPKVYRWLRLLAHHAPPDAGGGGNGKPRTEGTMRGRSQELPRPMVWGSSIGASRIILERLSAFLNRRIVAGQARPAGAGGGLL
jgi:hypothetical protein